ncbi:MAG TPA: UDP-N-acetylglucosamine 2-epimerase (non-hydrolyzing) [Bacteroidota bacterium]|nr:UDP-N-acetylglucosamine 2-epimerase (non-hydrolyzing) [Bacteroidota bacterium]
MMKKKKIAVVFGTRPDAIKSAPVLKELANDRSAFTVVPIVTAQHREMLDQVLKTFRIRPRHDLNIMRHGQSLASITGRSIGPLDALFSRLRPDMVLVQGDTTTTFVAALAAFYGRIPVGHIEAGLRTNDSANPFPEEMNRRLTSAIATLHFAPTETACHALMKEGIDRKKIFITGNTVIDALRMAVKSSHRFTDARIRRFVASHQKIVLVTMHRRENWGEPMRIASQAIARIAREHPGAQIVIPMHKNPDVRLLLRAGLSGIPNVLLCEPLAYGDFVNLMAASHFILTDSGGIQEEAPSLGKPVLVLRTVTERPEAVASGGVRLVGLDEERIVRGAQELFADQGAYARMSSAVNPYGDGCASERIAQIIRHHFGISASLPHEFKPA